MPMVSCKIDRAQIEKYTREQRASGQRVTLADQVCSGLKLVINNQRASWTYAYRKRGYLDGGKRHPQRTMKLGDPVNMTPAEARLAAEQIKALVRAGGDPAMAQRQERAARQAEEARRKTCSDWLDKYALNQMDGGRTKYQREEVRNAQLALEEMGLLELFPDAVTPKHIRNLIDLHGSRPATGRQRFGALSRFLDYLLDEDVIDLNPANAVSRKRRPKPPAPRTNYFSPDELRRLWHADGLRPQYQRYLRFMITTPLRADEGAELRWDQVILDHDEIRLTANDTKNAEYFVMPLTQLSKNLLTPTKPATGTKVFQLSRIADGKMTSWSHFANAVRKASGVDKFALHDLRRTFSTLMAEHTDVPMDIIDGLLNHKQSATRGGVIKHYQQAKLLGKRREAMQSWERLLESFL